MTKILLSILIWIVLTSTTFAQTAPPEQWTPETRLKMAQAWILEAGWGKNLIKREEQHAIGYVIVTRWRQMSSAANKDGKIYPSLRLIDVIKYYCSGFKRGHPSKRQAWARNLFGHVEPMGWPAHKASWKRHLPYWMDTLERVNQFVLGKVRNPCPGASHFGGLRAGDIPRGRMVRHKCSDRFDQRKIPGTTFYIVSRKHPLPDQPDSGV
jgi:hypothetical protein